MTKMKIARPLLEKVLQNSEIACEFEAPEKSSLFFSFDNIQTLFKSHMIGGEEQKKVLAIPFFFFYKNNLIRTSSLRF